MDQLLDEIMELFDESDKAIDETKQKQEEEVKKAEEMRKRSLETFKESAKRNGDEQQGAKQRKTRASGANTMASLKERAETEATLKWEKLEIKRKELALQAKEKEGRQQGFDMMNKLTRNPTASAAADAVVYANECKHDAGAPTTNSRNYGADEKVC